MWFTLDSWTIKAHQSCYIIHSGLVYEAHQSCYLIHSGLVDKAHQSCYMIHSGLKEKARQSCFLNLLSDYEINNSNIKKFYDWTKCNIILFTLVVGISFFINIWASVMKEP